MSGGEIVKRLVAIGAVTALVLLITLVGYAAPASANTVVWSENWDSYTAGTHIVDVGGWKPWQNISALGAGATVSNTQAHSGPNSLCVYTPSSTCHVVYEFSGCDSGKWILTFWQYVPSPFTGSSVDVDLYNRYSDTGPANWSSDLYPDVSTSEFWGATASLELPSYPCSRTSGSRSEWR